MKKAKGMLEIEPEVLQALRIRKAQDGEKRLSDVIKKLLAEEKNAAGGNRRA